MVQKVLVQRVSLSTKKLPSLVRVDCCFKMYATREFDESSCLQFVSPVTPKTILLAFCSVCDTNTHPACILLVCDTKNPEV